MYLKMVKHIAYIPRRGQKKFCMASDLSAMQPVQKFSLVEAVALTRKKKNLTVSL